MPETEIIDYAITDPLELNLSYMPFIKNGGLFIPTSKIFSLGDLILVDLHFPEKKDSLRIKGNVIWIIPKNALHNVLPGVGIQFIGDNIPTIITEIENHLDKSMEIGGYVYGISEETKKS